jgi:hypothetical protein
VDEAATTVEEEGDREAVVEEEGEGELAVDVAALLAVRVLAV